MKKYKCLDCGHQFEGDISTTQCPECGSTNIKPASQGISPIVWKILLVIGICGVIVAILTTIEKTINVCLDTSSKEYIKISTEDITSKNLKSFYKIEITNDSTLEKKIQNFGGTHNYTNIYTHDMIPGVTYHFFLVDKKTGVQPTNVKWNRNSYTKPLPPVQPEISISKVSDCNSKKYTITINVIKGNADVFYLGNKSQSSNVFTNVSDGTTYTIKVCDTPNNLFSEEHRVTCPTITQFHVTEAAIQDALNKVAKREMQPGDALKVINNGRNIRLTQAIDGNSRLEGALSFSYTQRKRYIVRTVIEANDCSDVIRSITLSNPR